MNKFKNNDLLHDLIKRGWKNWPKSFKFGVLLAIISFILLGILVVKMLSDPDNFNSFKERMNLYKHGNNTSILDVIENPQNYVGQEIKLNDVILCLTDGIVAYKEDGTRIKMDFTRDYIPGRTSPVDEEKVYTLYGEVISINSFEDRHFLCQQHSYQCSEGIVNGFGEYYFKVNTIVTKETVREYNIKGHNHVC